MKKRSELPALLLEWLLICVGVLGSVLCPCTAFDFPIPEAIWFLVPALALAGALLFRGKPGKYYALGFLVLLLALGWLWREELLEGLRNLWGELGKFYGRGYDRIRDYLPREDTSPDALWPGLLLLTVLETYLCTLAVRLWKRTTPAALSLLPCILLCFILTDTPPALLPLLAAVFSVLTQAFSQSVRRRAAGEEAKSILLSALIAGGLLGLLLLIFPREDYKPPITWDELSREMARWNQRQDNRGNVNAGLAGNPSAVDLSELGALPNRPVTALYVTSSIDDYLYLRGSSFDQFDGRVWSRDEGRNWGEAALYPYLDQARGYELRIETRDPESLFYTVYQLTSLPAGGAPVSDAYLANPEGRTSYTMQYLPVTGTAPANEASDEWVRVRCTALPERTREGVLAWWETHRGELGDPPAALSLDGIDPSLIPYISSSPEAASQMSRDSLILYAREVAALVSQTARYSRDPARMPEGQDFCTWFLNEAEEGYCVHYATACTALLRALGVPARYVSGYVTGVTAGVPTVVNNLQAHAWVEIWAGGRWVPVEPTPDYATEFTGRIPGATNPVPTTTEAPEETTAPPATPPAPETRPPRPSVDHTAPTLDTAEPGYGSGSDAGPWNMTALWIFLGVVGVPALALLRRELALRLWERKLARAKANKRARLLYRQIQRLHRLGGGDIPPEAEALAKKAAFSQHVLDIDELQYLRQVLDHQCFRLRIAGFWKRFYCKYILAII